jgi:hypothetical protein
MECFYCISAQGGELVAITGLLPNKYLFFIFKLMRAFILSGQYTSSAFLFSACSIAGVGQCFFFSVPWSA